MKDLKKKLYVVMDVLCVIIGEFYSQRFKKTFEVFALVEGMPFRFFPPIQPVGIFYFNFLQNVFLNARFKSLQ